jgi:uncharacterized surface protein with fasciclin (FAS1) repeats
MAVVCALGLSVAPRAEATSAAPSPSIVDLVIDSCDKPATGALPQFCVLKAAVLAADPAVLARLSSRGQVTVFAPTDQAFLDLLAELGLGGLDDIDQATLTQVLLYHVVPGARTAESVLPASRLRTLQGGFLQQAGGVLTDNNGRYASIVGVDIRATNGVVHVINRVVLP